MFLIEKKRDPALIHNVLLNQTNFRFSFDTNSLPLHYWNWNNLELGVKLLVNAFDFFISLRVCQSEMEFSTSIESDLPSRLID